MRAAIDAPAGPSSALRVVERDDPPEPGAQQVRIKIIVSGVNPTDWKARASGPRRGPESGDRVPNQDGAGVVDAVGPEVDDLSAGDRVWVFLAAHATPTSGTAQEFTVLPRSHVVRLPDSASSDTGASLGVPAMTAHRALTVAESGPSRLEPGALAGRTVLVHGGAGAVGHAAIQLARWAGARVITTVSSAWKGELAAAAGAHHVVDYRRSDPIREILSHAPERVDQIVEVSPARNAELDAAVLANHGLVAVYADDSLAPELNTWPLLAANIRYQFLLLYTVGQEALRAASLDISHALEDQALSVGADAGLPIARFPLEEISAAHDAVRRGFVGKVLVDVAD